MGNSNSSIKVCIATRQYLIRIGIKALINHLGIEPVYLEARNIEDIPFKKCSENDYLIVHHKLLARLPENGFLSILQKFRGKVLVIGNEKMSPNFHPYLLLPTDSETETLEKLQNFFSSYTVNEQETENGVLSAREIDILKEVARGYSNKEIADRLFISINTVITHRKNLTEKLGIKTISGLTVYALMNNLITPEDVTV